MTQYDVFRLGSGPPDQLGSYVIVLQSSHTASLASVIVAPLHGIAAHERLSRLHISLEVEERPLCIVMPELGAFPKSRLTRRVMNANHVHADIMSALDLLFAGF